MAPTNPDNQAAAVVYVANIRALCEASGITLDQLDERTQRTLEVMLATHPDWGPALARFGGTVRDEATNAAARACVCLGGEL